MKEGMKNIMKLREKMDIVKTLAVYMAAVLVPVLCFVIVDSFTYNPVQYISPEAWLLNIIFYYCLFAILYGITGNINIGLIIEMAISLLAGLANYFVIQFRSSPIVPWDLLSAKTAFSVSDNYTFVFTDRMKAKIVICCALMILLALISVRKQVPLKIRIIKRSISLALGIGFMSLLTFAVQQESVIEWAGLNNTLFTPKVMNRENGFAVMFMMDMKYMNVSKPDGYSADEVKKWLEEYESGENDKTDSKELPDIIVIMDECFSDPGVLTDFTTEEDYMPFIHKLQQGYDNTITGNLHVSVLGGNTANTEFEFLTGNTMAFLPSGCVPYQQYIKGDITSVVSQLKELGYTTNAVHPYYASGWNRDKVYKYMGFDNTYFKDSFDSDAEIIRKYISDASAFDKVLEIMDGQESPTFTFLVTMQNHSAFGRSYPGFNPDVVINGTSSVYPTNYLSLMKITDSALEDLIGKLEKSERETVVVFFGDHQPYDIIVNPLLELNGKSCDTLSESELYKRYEVPYIIWANFDISGESGLDTSPNYLASLLFERCGIPTSPYQNMLLELMKEVPVVSSQYTDGDKNSKAMDKYRKIQYYMMFDEN